MSAFMTDTQVKFVNTPTTKENQQNNNKQTTNKHGQYTYNKSTKC
jgi:hypothetical protein